MIQPAIVEEIQNDGTVLVRYPNPKAEKSQTSRSFWKVKERSFPVDNPENIQVNPKELVEIEVDPSGAIKAAFMIFMLPLLGFLAFYGSGTLIIKSEGLLFLLGVLGFACGMGVNILVRKFKGQGTLPVLKRRMSLEDIEEFKSAHDACKGCKGCG
jgi:positive regulator of sigma E activity